MRKPELSAVSLAATLCALFGLAELARSAPPRSATVFFAELRGTINPAGGSYLETAIREAEKADAEALVLELDTPGGLVSAVREMAQHVDRAKIPVVVFVHPGGASATSAGALLMLASHVTAMAPGTNVGAAHPVDSSGKDIEGKMAEKAINDTAAFARSLAEARKRDPILAQEIVSKSRSLTAPEAKDKGLVDVIAATRRELLEKLDGRVVKVAGGLTRVIRSAGASEREIEMSLGQKLLHYLANPNIAAVLMTLGMLLIYVEVSNPGITIAGVLGGICLLVAFMAFQMLPIRLGGLLLVGLGLLLMLLEPFVTSHGALAGGGVLAFVLGLIWVVDPEGGVPQVSVGVWAPAGIALGGGAALLGYAAARSTLLATRAIRAMGGGGIAGLQGYVGHMQTVEKSPFGGFLGKALFRGETWDVRSEVPLRVGDPVEAVSVDGMHVQVRPAGPGSTKKES